MSREQDLPVLYSYIPDGDTVGSSVGAVGVKVGSEVGSAISERGRKESSVSV